MRIGAYGSESGAIAPENVTQIARIIAALPNDTALVKQVVVKNAAAKTLIPVPRTLLPNYSND